MFLDDFVVILVQYTGYLITFLKICSILVNRLTSILDCFKRFCMVLVRFLTSTPDNVCSDFILFSLGYLLVWLQFVAILYDS